MVIVVDVGEPVPPKAGVFVLPNLTVKVWSPSRSSSSLIVTSIQAWETAPISNLNNVAVELKSVPFTGKQGTKIIHKCFKRLVYQKIGNSKYDSAQKEYMLLTSIKRITLIPSMFEQLNHICLKKASTHAMQCHPLHLSQYRASSCLASLDCMVDLSTKNTSLLQSCYIHSKMQPVPWHIVKLQELLYEYMLKYIYGYCILLLLMMVSWEASTKHLLLVCIRVVNCLKCLPLFIGKLSDSGHGTTVICSMMLN